MTKHPITVHVATVGVSLFENLLTEASSKVEEVLGDTDLSRAVFNERERIHDLKGELKNPREEVLRVSEKLIKETSDEGQAREALEDLVEEISPDLWPRDVSAELASLAANRGGNPRLDIGGEIDETVLLIASDTGRGLRAALFNALVITSGDVDRVDYLPTPNSTFRVEHGRVTIVRLPGLDAENNEQFLRAMRELSAFGPFFEEALRNPESTCRFHLTGGFRVAMPFLLGFAQALHSLYDGQISTHAQYEFSSSPRSIELPLSAPRTDDLEGKLAGSDDDGYFENEPPEGNIWEGFAYEFVPDQLRWRLTPFGMALRELIPKTKNAP